VSLINQVLKDLEQRHAREMAEATHSLDGLALPTSLARKPSRHRSGWLALVGIIAIAAAAGIGWWQRDTSPHRTPIAGTAISPQPKSKATLKHPATQSFAFAANAVHRHTHIPVQTHHQQRHTTSLPDKTKHQHKHRPVLNASAKHKDLDGGMQKQRVPLRADQKAEIAYQAGYDEIELHHLSRAERQLRQALSLDPEHLRARELLAGLLIKQGRWVEASSLMQRGVQLHPANTLFRKLDARVLMQLNRNQQAITLLLAHTPPIAHDPEYYALLAALYQRQHDHRDAAKTYAKILKLRPDAAIWWVGLGISLEALGKQRQAQQAYARARKTGVLQGNLARFTDNRLLALDAINYPNK